MIITHENLEYLFGLQVADLVLLLYFSKNLFICLIIFQIVLREKKMFSGLAFRKQFMACITVGNI